MYIYIHIYIYICVYVVAAQEAREGKKQEVVVVEEATRASRLVLMLCIMLKHVLPVEARCYMFV